MNDSQMSRRKFLSGGAKLGSAMLISASVARPLTLAAMEASSKPTEFTQHEWDTVEAMTAHIIPTDHEPGAVEANCVNFIDKAIGNEDAAAKPMYNYGLMAVDGIATGVFGKPFVKLTSAQQIEMLQMLETGTDAWPKELPFPSQFFFENFRLHTIVGFLSMPKYGGNQNYAGWQVVKYPGGEHFSGGYSKEQVEGKAPLTPIWEIKTIHKHHNH